MTAQIQTPSLIQSPSIPKPRRGAVAYRWVRKLHLWIGAWGALGAVLYGSTGLIMSHRLGEGAWPQGDTSEIGRSTLQVPVEARDSAETLSLWLRDAHDLDAQTIRKPRGGGEGRGPQAWSLSGGTAAESWSVEYKPGDAEVEVKRSRHSTLAALNRMHKAVAGGPGWRLLGDSFAVSMVLLGLSGLWLWVRGRSVRQMVISIVGVSVLAMGVILGMNLL